MGILSMFAKKRTEINTALSAKAKINRTKFSIESKGFKKQGIYNNGSTSFRWAVARHKRDGYACASSVVPYGDGKELAVLFVKKLSTKAPKKATRTVRKAAKKPVVRKPTVRKPAVKLWHGLPVIATIAGKKYELYNRYDEDERSEANYEAKALRAKGKTVTVRHMKNYEGEYKYAVYVLKKARRA